MADGTRHWQDLVELLEERLPEEHVQLYRSLHDSHFHFWKLHRASQSESVQGLRTVLFAAGLVRIQPEPEHPNSRAFHDYASGLGLPLDGFDEEARAAGRVLLNERTFSEPGDGYGMYLDTRLGWTARGQGAALYFTVRETLRNCLRDQVRTDGHRSLAAFRAPALDALLHRYEVATVVDAVAGLHGPGVDVLPELEELHALAAEGALEEGELRRRDEAIDRILRQGPEASRRSEHAPIVFTMLGLLIDELISRCRVANGMEFSYPFIHAALTALLGRAPELRESLEAVAPDMDDLFDELQRLDWLADAATAPPVTDLERAGDRLRDLGFALRRVRRHDVETADLVFTAGNALWRWAFFVEQLPGEAPPPDGIAPDRKRIAETLLRHLRRPWGIVTVHDVRQAFRGWVPGDEEDELPRAFSVLSPLLSSDLEPFLASEAGIADPQQARRLTLRFIVCRYLLHDTRLRVRTIHVEQTDDRVIADLLVKLFERWAYDSDDRLASIDEDPEIMIELLRSGEWCDDLSYETELPSESAEVVRRYRTDPEGTVEHLFRFGEPDFVLVDHLGFMPPEQFTLASRAD